MDLTVVFVSFGRSNTNAQVIWSGQEGSTARRWNCEEDPGRAKGDGSLRQTIWCTTRPRRALVLCTLDGAGAEPRTTHQLGVS